MPILLYCEWKGYKFAVRMSRKGVVYRDAEHLGGPWSDVVKTIANTTYDAGFRKALAKVAAEVANYAK